MTVTISDTTASKIPNDQLHFIAEFIEQELGIIFREENFYQLHQRLEGVAQFLGITPLEVVPKAKREGITGDFRQYLLDIATNNETSFFRDPKVFNVIEKDILPKLQTYRPGAFSYRIWSAAASFGQEPYSLAMLVHSFLHANPAHPNIEIHATDVAEHALKRCRQAQYSQLEIQRGLPALRLVKYFEKVDDSTWAFKPEFRSLVQFKKQNLLDPFTTMGQFDLILCRYVLIYQDAAKKKEILDRLVQCLYPGGFLVLGGTETTVGLTTDLEQINADGAVYYRKKTRC